MPCCSFLEGLLEEDVAVGHLQRLGVAQVELVLPQPPLALGGFHRDTGVLEGAAGSGGKALGAAALEDVVVLQVPAGGLQVGVAPLGRFAVGVGENVVLELRSRHHLVAVSGGRLELLAQQAARRQRHQLVGFRVQHVGQHQSGPVGPGGQAQGVHVGHQMDVAVAQFPVGEVVTGHRRHLHVDGQQVVAGVGARPGGVFQKKFGVEAFAHQPAVEVGEGHDHRFDIALGHQPGQGVEREFALQILHNRSFGSVYCPILTLKQSRQARLVMEVVMPARWSLQDAKNKFSEVARRARSEGPQFVTP